jgi:hypothetical protein
MNNDYGVSHKITKKGMLKMFWTCMTSSSIGFGSLELDYDPTDYGNARKKLSAKGDTPCWEDVLVEMLRQGKKLAWFDVEEEGLEERHWFTLDDLIDNFEDVNNYHLADLLAGGDDAVTHDSILQCLLLGEIVYG